MGNKGVNKNTKAMDQDPELQAERMMIKNPQKAEQIRLNWQQGQGGHRPSQDTLRLLNEVGGVEALEKFTNIFYDKSFVDPHISLFIRDTTDPHGHRFATWVAEKMDGKPTWTNEARKRKVCPF